MILEYDWRAFETDSPKKTQSTSSQTTFRGLVNIGNCTILSIFSMLFEQFPSMSFSYKAIEEVNPTNKHKGNGE